VRRPSGAQRVVEYVLHGLDWERAQSLRDEFLEYIRRDLGVPD
jgi:hypothetical protein